MKKILEPFGVRKEKELEVKRKGRGRWERWNERVNREGKEEKLWLRREEKERAGEKELTAWVTGENLVMTGLTNWRTDWLSGVEGRSDWEMREDMRRYLIARLTGWLTDWRILWLKAWIITWYFTRGVKPKLMLRKLEMTIVGDELSMRWEGN